MLLSLTMEAATVKQTQSENEGTTVDESSSRTGTDKQLQYGGSMNAERLQTSLEGIQTLLSHLHGEITALEASYSEVIQLIRKLEGVCEMDDMTGLLRRRSFFSKWKVLLEECHRLNEDCGVIMIDIDHFKKINDTHGHPTGDEVIKRIAHLLQQYQNPHCIVGRYGGEEFAIALQGNEAEIQGVAERIRQEAESLCIPALGEDGQSSNGVQLRCTVSVGVASAHHQVFDAPRLLQSADQALYEAKNGGRNRVEVAA